MFTIAGTHPRDVQEATRPVASTLLQKYGTRGTVAGMCTETHDNYSANYRICENGTWFYEIIAR